MRGSNAHAMRGSRFGFAEDAAGCNPTGALEQKHDLRRVFLYMFTLRRGMCAYIGSNPVLCWSDKKHDADSCEARQETKSGFTVIA